MRTNLVSVHSQDYADSEYVSYLA